MIRNVGTVDRIIRVVIGIALLGLFWLSGPERWLGLLALVAFGTAAVGYCPLYSLLRLNTNRAKSAAG